MPYKDLHEEPFDESTIIKLEIFEDYAQAWIPTFVMQPQISEIHIFDFFSGTGFDKNGVPGSPIRILRKLKEQEANLSKKMVKVVVHLNEFEPKKRIQKKFEMLQAACSTFIIDNNLTQNVSIKYYNKNFESLFPELFPIIEKKPSLVYLDQNGIKFLSEKYFLELEKTTQTDFLYFVSSSYFWRFGEEDVFKIHLDIDMKTVKKQDYKSIHRNITEQLRQRLPKNSKLKLYPFSLKKEANIHGIIFGASHPRAVDKFLTIAWGKNPVNGDANYDIDDDSGKKQVDMFERKFTKIESFQREVTDRILQKKICNNFELLEFVYSQGHIPKHAADCLRKLKSEGKISYDGASPLVTYDNVYKIKKRIKYEVMG